MLLSRTRLKVWQLSRPTTDHCRQTTRIALILCTNVQWAVHSKPQHMGTVCSRDMHACLAHRSLHNITSLDSLNEQLLSVLRMRRVPFTLIKGIPAEQHGVQHHPAGPHICWPAFITFILSHIPQHFRRCTTAHAKSHINTKSQINKRDKQM